MKIKNSFRFKNWRNLILLTFSLMAILSVHSLAMAATIGVNSTGDTRVAGDTNCDLVEAINNANAQGVDTTAGDCATSTVGSNDISFAIPGGGPQLINITSEMPAVTSEVHIDGITQDPSASCSPRNLFVSIDGGENTQKVFYFLSGSQNSTVQGLNIYGTTVAAIDISTDNINIACNNIGTDLAGTALAPDVNEDTGIRFEGPAVGSTIGGSGETARNIVSGSTHSGIWLISSTPGDVNNITIEGNYVGTDVSGTVAIPNGSGGLQLQESDNNTIGGSLAGQGNLFSGNAQDGVFLGGTNGSNNNTFYNNLIGTDASGNLDLGNSENGLNMAKGSNNRFGSPIAGGRNIFSGNDDEGMAIGDGSNNIIQNNYFGLGAGGGTLGNTFDGLNMAKSGGSTIDSNTIGGNSGLSEGNVFSGNGGDGMATNGDTNSVITGNIFGLDPTGNSKIPNLASGLAPNTSGFATIGGATAGEGNIISGNGQDGIHFDFSHDFVIKGNMIGPDATGTINLGNGNDGMVLANQDDNATIGGPLAGERNIISGNGSDGIDEPSGDSTIIQGNYIGTDISGAVAMPNHFSGININGGGGGTRNNDVIGGAAAGEGNLISGNTGHGLSANGTNLTIKGNIVGLTANGLSALGNGQNGIDLNGSTTVTIGGTAAGDRNIISGNAQIGLALFSGTTGVTVFGNYIGTDISGNVALGNGQDGIQTGGLSSSTIGGPLAGERNIIVANSSMGIYMGSDVDSVTIQNNYIGVDLAGDPMGNTAFGILDGGQSNIIGGSNANEGNVISANGEGGLALVEQGPTPVTNNLVRGNFIGTNTAGAVTPGFGNSGFGGIIAAFGTTNNEIGGVNPGDGNTIAGNNGVGIYIFQITALGGPEPEGESILGNSIHDNSALGIDEATDTDGDFIPDQDAGPDTNDALDSDVGPNDYLNHPILYNILPAGPGLAQVDYFLDVPAKNYRVEFFKNTSADPSGFGEGETYVDSDSIVHPGGGVQFFSKNIAANPGDIITATVTEDLGAGAYGSTSEFSPTTVVAGTGVDFGDAPDTGAGTGVGNYNTLAGDRGAYHVINGSLFLGECVDADLGDLQNANADADDTSTTLPFSGVCAVPGHDEDGITLPATITEGTNFNVDAVSSGAGFLNAWIDFNRDGDFDDAGEHVMVDQAVVGGANSFSFTAPTPVAPGVSYARFRLSPGTGITPYDEVIGGEVEDYKVTLVGSGVVGGGGGGGSGGGSSGGGGGSAAFGKPACSGSACGNTATTSTPIGGGTTPANPPIISCGRDTVPFPFVDAVNHPERNAIEYLFRNCVVDGKVSSKFYPEDKTSRAEVTKIAVRLFKLPDAAFTNIFEDVHGQDWFAPYVMSAAKAQVVKGITSDDGGKVFKPNQAVTVAEALKILLKAKGTVIENDSGNPDNWYSGIISYATDHQIIGAQNGAAGGAKFFGPTQSISRADISKIAQTIANLK